MYEMIDRALSEEQRMMQAMFPHTAGRYAGPES